MARDLPALQAAIRDFARERDWDQFHSPKNLSAALAVEAAELLEHFQWLTEEQSAALPNERLEKIAHELADVLIYTLQLAAKLDIDPLQAAWDKLRMNGEKYPVDLAKGKMTKYTDL